jgi:nucleoside-diphosphate-sugar epimerase
LSIALVTGANGFIGSHLVESLLDKKYSVKCLVRKTADIKWLKDKNADLVYGDMFSKDVLSEALKDADYLYHVAGVTFAKKKSDFQRGNVEAVKSLLKP